VPDFVEWCGDYMDYSWQVEITETGFRAPGLVAGYYNVGFESMEYYGYTQPSLGTTRIVLHNNFHGFPTNDDPDGDQKGAAKVTACHEFKHASQYTTSHWSEGGWVEIDATWAEEFVYPQVNDYHWYVQYPGSPLSSPHLSLDDGGTGSYDDCIWQQYMSEMWTAQMLVDFWEHRRTHTGQSMLDSYDAVLGTYGSSVSDVMAKWTRWNYLTGSRAEPGFGYPDSPGFQTAAQWLNVNGLGVLRSSSLPHLATKYSRHHSVSGIDGYPKVVFDGATGIDFRPQIIVKKNDETLVFDVIEIDGTGAGEKVLDIPFSEIDEIGLSFANCEHTGSSKSYNYRMFSDPGTGIDGDAEYGVMRLHPSFPNPFNPKTTIRFQLAGDHAVDLTVVTPSGRVVRHLVNGELHEAGEHEIVFDGRDDAGNELASGVYFAMLSVGGTESQLTKLTLLK